MNGKHIVIISIFFISIILTLIDSTEWIGIWVIGIIVGTVFSSQFVRLVELLGNRLDKAITERNRPKGEK